MRLTTLGRNFVNFTAIFVNLMALVGCAQTPITVVERVNVPTYIPIPSTLTQAISVDLTGATWGSAVGDLKAGLEACEADKAAIKGLKTPPPRPL